VFGTTALSYGTSYRIIVRTDPLGSNTIVYVNPTSGVLGQQTPYLTASGGAGITPATALDSFILNENKNGSAATVGAGISKVCVASGYTSVYDFLSGTQTPVASFTGNPTIGTGPLNVTFTDTSTGTISNRFWNFGDSGTTNVTTNVVAHTYAAGTYTVTLIVSGSDGASTNTQPNYISVLTTFQAWQLQYFGSTNGSAAANADPDGDGQNNLAESQAGTDPTNGASAFRIIEIESEGNDVLLTWTTVGGKKYAVQSVTGGDYTNAFIEFAPAFIAPGTGESTFSVIHLGGATNAPSRFYRIRLVP
jgi:PKD repeat protein